MKFPAYLGFKLYGPIDTWIGYTGHIQGVPGGM